MLLFKSLTVLKGPFPRVSGIKTKSNAFIASEFFILSLAIVLYAYSPHVAASRVKFTYAPAVVNDTALTLRPGKILTSMEMNEGLWRYLRAGLNYLEASGKDYPPNFEHPGKKAYGALGLSRIAAQDVLQHYPALSKFSLEDVFSDREVYEVFAQKYAELLLRRYLKVDYEAMAAPEVFNVLQKAWFLGPGLFKAGVRVIASREKRAQEYAGRPQ
jgi:hypothetical protein